jgi:Protein of unknown function (DUF2842)
MSVRTRKLLGAIALLLLVGIWSLLAMTVAQVLLVSASASVVMIYYLVAGFAWVLPAMPLIRWMSRSGSEEIRRR